MNTDHPRNLSNDPVMVHHANLIRVGDSAFKSVCPFCKEGVLLVRRDPETVELLPEDTCTLCEQRVIYAEFHSATRDFV